MASQVVLVARNLPGNAGETRLGTSLSQEDALEEEMATHSSILAWKIPWTEEPGGIHTVHGVPKSQCIADPARHANCSAVHTACAVHWTQIGKAQAKRLEDLRILRNCRHVYSLLTSAAAVTAAIRYQRQHHLSPGWRSSCSSRRAIFSPLLADLTDTAVMQQ